MKIGKTKIFRNNKIGNYKIYIPAGLRELFGEYIYFDLEKMEITLCISLDNRKSKKITKHNHIGFIDYDVLEEDMVGEYYVEKIDDITFYLEKI